MNVSKRKFSSTCICLLVCIIFIGVLLVVENSGNKESAFYKLCELGSLLVLIFEIYHIKKISASYLNAIVLFLSSFYIFQNGQLLLYALNVDFSLFYISVAGKYLKEIYLFTAISNVLAGLAGVVLAKPMKKKKLIVIDDNNEGLFSKIENAAFLGFVMTGIIAVPLILIKFVISLGGGYHAVRLFEGHVPTIIGFVEYMFAPFSILALVYQNKKNKIVFYVFILWSLLTALCGDRTSGIAGLVIVFYIGNLRKQINGEKQHIIPTIFAGCVSIVLIRVASAFRSQTTIWNSLGGMTQIATDFISELGFSFFPLYTVMSIIPSSETFLKGSTYIASFISGAIPAFIDPTGIIRSLERIAHSNDRWQSTYFSQYSFGFGYSLNAEAYANFGWLGLIAIFIVCCLVFYFLQRTKDDKQYPMFSIYKQCVLLFVWLTLPRRDTYLSLIHISEPRDA